MRKYGALPFTWGRFVRDGHGYAMLVRALLVHPLGLTLQPTSTICRGRRTEAPASARPQSPDPPAPRASVTGRVAFYTWSFNAIMTKPTINFIRTLYWSCL